MPIRIARLQAKEEVGRGIEVPLEESAANAREILSEAAAWLPTLWIGLLPMNDALPYPQLLAGPQDRFSNEQQAVYNARYAEVAREIGVPLLDLHASFLTEPRWMSLTQMGDGSNPPGKGIAFINIFTMTEAEKERSDG